MIVCYSETVNVTISLDDELVRRAKHLAVDRGVSLSRLIGELLRERIGDDVERRGARERRRRMMIEGLDLGTRGRITWTRDELHAR